MMVKQERGLVGNPVPIVERVRKALAEDVGPALGLEGSAIEVIEVDGGVARLRLAGGCTGCPSSIMTVIMGVEQELRKQIPEVEYVEMTG
jgi:Fe-S cluster biogenesis protein NfuA